ncbi:hypothetical protein ANPL_01380 [Anaplasma platys]|uniref:Uncharacterized protein n=1 Tax=Anaplasma platys TaxID=949 RepID=A0A858PXS6_9RICK|nr:hypothetical protein [Anaplasma platys]QJC27385.1 hypothetical protein ANPL_01380 [Anaplasma platys]
MALKILEVFLAVLAIVVFLGLLRLSFGAVRDFVIRLFSGHDEEENLTEEEKHRRYLEKKHREIVREKVQVQVLQQSHEEQSEYQSAVRIIGLMEPIGRWTRYVMSEKRQRLGGIKSSDIPNGFWQMLVSMKGMYQGKYKGRSR